MTIDSQWGDEMILPRGFIRLRVHPRYSTQAQVTVLLERGWWTVFVHCGPAADQPEREA